MSGRRMAARSYLTPASPTATRSFYKYSGAGSDTRNGQRRGQTSEGKRNAPPWNLGFFFFMNPSMTAAGRQAGRRRDMCHGPGLHSQSSVPWLMLKVSFSGRRSVS